MFNLLQHFIPRNISYAIGRKINELLSSCYDKIFTGLEAERDRRMWSFLLNVALFRIPRAICALAFSPFLSL